MNFVAWIIKYYKGVAIMELLKRIALAVWMNHRKKFIAFVLSLLFGALASLSGMPLSEIKEAAIDAVNKPESSAPALPAVVAPAPVVEEKAAEVK